MAATNTPGAAASASRASADSSISAAALRCRPRSTPPTNNDIVGCLSASRPSRIASRSYFTDGLGRDAFGPPPARRTHGAGQLHWLFVVWGFWAGRNRVPVEPDNVHRRASHRISSSRFPQRRNPTGDGKDQEWVCDEGQRRGGRQQLFTSKHACRRNVREN